MTSLLPVVMLVTGTSVAIVTQLFFNQAAVSPSTHILAWVKYIAPLIVELAMLPTRRASGRAPPLKPESRTYLWIIGALDIFAYTLMSSAFAACGSSFASVIIAAANQICNAAAAVLVRKKKLGPQKLTGVLVVTVGLLIRMAPFVNGSATGQGPAFTLSTQEALGVVAMVVSAATYAALGVVYEWMLELEGKNVSHTEINRTISIVGATVMTGYQLVYTLPQWETLVARPLAKSTASLGKVIGTLAVLGGCFLVHTNMTSKVIQSSGALAVSVINAFRSAVLMVIGHMMFCSAAKPLQCMTPVAVASAVVITIGVLCWSLPGSSLAPKPGAAPLQHPGTGGSEKSKAE